MLSYVKWNENVKTQVQQSMLSVFPAQDLCRQGSGEMEDCSVFQVTFDIKEIL